MKTLARWTLAALLALASLPGPAAAAIADEPPQPDAPVSLSRLAKAADFVGLAQVKDTDYLRRRGIPISGSAYLKVLIAYKSTVREDLIEVYEKGLHEHECYFPNPDVFEEGRRYLLFLRRDPEHAERYRGLPQGCAIDVLVDSDNRYAVRLPVTGMQLADELDELAQPLQFSDPYAVVDDEALPAALRDALRAAGQIVPHSPAGEEPSDRRWIYTRGVPLIEFREMLQLEP